ncbi:MAG: hypothetical protein ABW019_04295 [Chitinophagaceae bacterium]
MRSIPVFAILSLTMLLAACGKDKFETKPLLEIKDYSAEAVSQGESVRIRVNYYDKEGDLGEGDFTYIRVRTNKTPIPNPGTYDKTDTIRSKVPVFPSKNTGELTFNVAYEFMDEDPNRNDTMYFKIAVVDIKGNASDTITTGLFVARQ